MRLHDEGTFDSLNPFIVKGNPAAGLSFLGTGLVYEALMDQSNDEPFTMYGVLARVDRTPPPITAGSRSTSAQKRTGPTGVPVKADDVVWTFNTMMSKGTPFFKAYYGDVASVEATGERRVKFTFRHPRQHRTAADRQSDEHPAQTFTGTRKTATSARRRWSRRSAAAPIKSARCPPAVSIEYVRDPKWWGAKLAINKGRWNFDRITYDYYRDARRVAGGLLRRAI